MKNLLHQPAKIFLLAIGLLSPALTHAHEELGESLKSGSAKSEPITFIENKGQWVSEAKYKAVIPGGEMYITSTGFKYNFISQTDVDRIHELTCGEHHKEGVNVDNEIVNMHAYGVNFVGANTSSTLRYVSEEKKPGYINYFIGNDASKWTSNCGMYGKVLVENIYQNIDLQVYTSDSKRNIKYDIIVKPGASTSSVQLAFDGVSPKLNSKGDLVIKTSVNEVTESAPITYQIIEGKKVAVASKYVLKDGKLSFNFPNGYNNNFDLVIDPSLIFYTYSGGVNYSFYSYTSGYDKNGNMVTAGDAWGAGWPVSSGAYQTTYGGGSHETCIMKITNDGTAMLWATYYGGSSWDLPHSVWVDDNLDVYIGGSTQSSNLPMAATAYDNTLGGTWDWYVCKLSANGTQLLGSTFLGGSGIDGQHFTFASTYLNSSNSWTNTPMQIYKDKLGNVWVAANSSSTDYPVTATAQYTTNAGGMDAVISKLDNNLSSLGYSTYIGGSGNDGLIAIDEQSNGNIVFAGITYSSNLPNANGLQTSSGGGQDGFVCIVNPTINQITNLTYLGTSGVDQSVGIQVDCGDNVYVLGHTSGNYPVSPGVWSVPNGTCTIDKLSPTLGARLLSTRVANPTNTAFVPASFMVDLCGRIYVGGFQAQSGLTTTADAYDATNKSFYFITLESNFSSLIYASYFGATTSDHNHLGSHRLDPRGFFYHTICNITQFTPINNSVYTPSKTTSGQDILSFKFNFDAVNLDANLISGYGGYDGLAHSVRGCKSAFINYHRSGDTTVPMILRFNFPTVAPNIAYNGVDYAQVSDSLYFAPYERNKALEIKPLLVSNMPTGQKIVIVEALNPCGCNGSFSNVVRRDTVYILDSLEGTINTPLPAYCPGSTATIIGNVDAKLNFNWTPTAYDTGNLTINPVMLTTRDYILKITQPGAPSTCPPVYRTFHAYVEQYPVVGMSSDTTVCITDSIAIPVTVSPDSVIYSYSWTPGTGLRATNISTNFFRMPEGTYNYSFTSTTPIANCSTTKNLTIHVRPPFQFTGLLPISGSTVNYLDEVQMSASGAMLYTWLPLGSFYDPTLPNPTTLPITGPGSYFVTGIDEYGCKDTAEIILNVKYPYDPIMPNAFSPNGDGKNDVFSIPNGKYVKIHTFEIRNRWGQRVFNTNDPLIGWDGTDARTGKPCTEGVYMYYLSIELPNKEIKSYKGDISLLR